MREITYLKKQTLKSDIFSPSRNNARIRYALNYKKYINNDKVDMGSFLYKQSNQNVCTATDIPNVRLAPIYKNKNELILGKTKIGEAIKYCSINYGVQLKLLKVKGDGACLWNCLYYWIKKLNKKFQFTTQGSSTPILNDYLDLRKLVINYANNNRGERISEFSEETCDAVFNENEYIKLVNTPSIFGREIDARLTCKLYNMKILCLSADDALRIYYDSFYYKVSNVFEGYIYNYKGMHFDVLEILEAQ